MRHFFFASVFACLTATWAHAGMKLHDIKAAYGLTWPERPAAEYHPIDVILFRFLVQGARVDPEGRASLEASVKLTDAQGHLTLFSPMPTVKYWVGSSGRAFVADAQAMLTSQVPPGSYTATVTVKDGISGEEATFDRPVVVKPTELAVTMPQYYADVERRVITGTTLQPTQPLYCVLPITGYDTSRGKVDLVVTMQVLDADGKEMIPNPPEAPLRRETVNALLDPPVMAYTNSVALTTPGDYTLRVSVTDRIGNKTARFDTPLHVLGP
jgi:hypothetical protein